MTNNTNSKNESLFIIGGSGLVGSRLIELLRSSYSIESAGISQGFDITRSDSMGTLIHSDARVVILLAAKTDVDGCEKDKDDGRNGESYKSNVLGPKNVAEICAKTGKKLVYFSTDFVFDGEKEPPYEYTEHDTPNPLNWYAQTKYDGEKVVLEHCDNSLILRIAYPYRAVFEKKKDFVRLIKSRLEEGLPVKAVTDHFMSPTFINDIAPALDACLKQDVTGIVHAVGEIAITPFDACLAIANEFGLPRDLVSKTTRNEFFSGRAKRPFNLALKNDTLHKLGVHMHSFEDGLSLMHKEILSQ